MVLELLNLQIILKFLVTYQLFKILEVSTFNIFLDFVAYVKNVDLLGGL